MQRLVEVNHKAYGSTDLWSFDLLEVGGPLPCNNIRTFLHYLCSRGTHVASIAPYTDPSARGSSPTIEVVLRGPRADDGEVLSISYLLRREKIHGGEGEHQGLEVWEKQLLGRAHHGTEASHTDQSLAASHKGLSGGSEVALCCLMVLSTTLLQRPFRKLTTKAVKRTQTDKRR